MQFTHTSSSVCMSFKVLSLAALLAAGSQAQHYTRTDLVSNVPGVASVTDPNLVNAWGLSRSSTGPWWVADNGSAKSTLYSGAGSKVPLTVPVPGFPTGTVFNGTSDFKLPNGTPAAFLFASEDGTVSAWSPGAPSAQAMISKAGAVYKGLAIAAIAGTNYLFATDFHGGAIDVFDSSFHLIKTYGDRFRAGCEGAITSEAAAENEGLSRSFDLVPFNVQNIGGNLYVTFAKQDAQKHDEVHGAGLGLVAAFTPSGQLLKVFRHGSWLNAPWGVTLAPGDFGYFSHTLLVGQFGSGQIGAYNLESGRFAGLLEDPSGNPIAIDGLWAISFGNGQAAGPANTLYFAAGPNGEANGLFGTLTAVPADQLLGNGK